MQLPSLGISYSDLVLGTLVRIHKANGKRNNFLFLLDPWQKMLSFSHSL